MTDAAFLTRTVAREMFRSDAAFVRLTREGMDEAIVASLDRLLDAPGWAGLAARVGRQYATIQGLSEALAELASPFTALDQRSIDFVAAISGLSEDRASEAAVSRALAGLLALAALEGLAKRHRPASAFPYLSVNTVEQIALPVADRLLEAGAFAGASALAQLLREYILSDPYQRLSGRGAEAIGRCRRIEAAAAEHVRNCCQDLAWQLHDGFEEYRPFVATLFFAAGDPIRAHAITGPRQYRPSLGVLVDLVEISVELVPVDPLLQAVWLYILGSTPIEPPLDLRYNLRRIIPEVNSAYKGADAGAREVLGLSISTAYAEGALRVVNGVMPDGWQESAWWNVLANAFKFAAAAHAFRSGYMRLLELFSLAAPVGTPLPTGELISSFAGQAPRPITDPRDAAALSLGLDQWTSSRAQIGRSLAYDSSFFVEPARREESPAESVDYLEHHRGAALKFWLMAIPPFVEERTVRDRRKRRILEEDFKLTREYRDLAHLATLGDRPLYCRLYGPDGFKRVLRVDESDLTMYLMKCDERRASLLQEAAEVFPEYARARSSEPATLDRMRALLDIG